MEQQKPKIAFYVRRSFGEKLNACFDFIKENWKPLLKYGTYFILPLALIQALSLNSMLGSAFAMGAMEETGYYDLPGSEAFLYNILMNYGLLILCMMAGSLLLTSVVYALVQLYNSREERLNNITFQDIKPLLFRNMKRIFLVLLFLFALYIAAIIALVLLAYLTPFTLVLTIPAMLACIFPLLLFMPIYTFENISIIGAFSKSFKLGFATWGGIFAIALVTGLIVSVVQGATSTPWTVVFFVKSILSYSDTGELAGNSSFMMSFWMYVLGVIQVYGMYISMIISMIGMLYQYGHASELVDSTSVESDIDKFENL